MPGRTAQAYMPLARGVDRTHLLKQALFVAILVILRMQRLVTFPLLGAAVAIASSNSSREQQQQP